jgi:hypothetical protein
VRCRQVNTSRRHLRGVGNPYSGLRVCHTSSTSLALASDSDAEPRLAFSPLDDPLELLASVAQLAHAHPRVPVVEQAPSGLLEHRGWQGRRAGREVVDLRAGVGHGGVQVAVVGPSFASGAIGVPETTRSVSLEGKECCSMLYMLYRSSLLEPGFPNRQVGMSRARTRQISRDKGECFCYVTPIAWPPHRQQLNRDSRSSSSVSHTKTMSLSPCPTSS